MERNNARTCGVADELGIQYLLALDQVETAQRERDHAVTITQQESAATRLSRVEGHRLYAMGELLSHCERHGCALPILDKGLMEILTSQPSGARKINDGQAAA
jgi:hypothetical protein